MSTRLLASHRQWLLELTGTPSAAGREGRVVAWITRWAARRPGLRLSADRWGNLTIQRKGLRPAAGSPGPLYFAAHMDHPSFVVEQVTDAQTLVAHFRGGVEERYFKGTPVLLHHADRLAQPGVVVDFLTSAKASAFAAHDNRLKLRIRLKHPASAAPGDILTWDVGPARIEGDWLHTPACDDQAGVAAALSAYDLLLKNPRRMGDVRLFLTRAEEMGFLGALAACRSRSLPKNARIIALENSRSYPESPIGAGPIVRVGDRTSTFDPDLTYRCAQIAQQLSQRDKTFQYQRKLMPGGTCEASVYQCFGYVATCLCLPLGNYHNMNEQAPGGPRIDAETISLRDHQGLIRLLAAIGRQLDDPQRSPSLRHRLDELFERRKYVLEDAIADRK